MQRKDIGRAAISSLGFVLPFMVLEWVNRRDLPEDFPIVLFGFLSLLSLSFFLVLMPVVRGLRPGKGAPVNRLRLLPGVVLALFIAWLYVGLVADQMPCFLGIPNCD